MKNKKRRQKMFWVQFIAPEGLEVEKEEAKQAELRKKHREENKQKKKQELQEKK